MGIQKLNSSKEVTSKKEEIQDSEDWYQRLLKTMNEGFSIRDENTLFTYVNDKFCEMLRYKREELLGRPIADFVDEADLPLLRKELERRKQGLRGSYELTWIRKDGEKLYSILSTAPLFDQEGNFRGGFGVKTDITSRKLAEKKLITYQEKLRSLASELSLVEERERRHIAAELHDRIGQTLAISKLKMGTLKESVTDPDLGTRLEEIKLLIDQAIRDTRSLTMELSPPILYELGFEAAVEWLSEQTLNQHEIHVQFASDNQEKPLSQDVQVLLFKIVQELFHNIIKHAGARTAKVSLSKVGEKINIFIEDDGVGFETDESGSRSGQTNGFGLFSIRERLDHLNGRFEIESKPGHGTHILISAPLQQTFKEFT
jgi:PAS domain S-box-containing protein